VRFLKELNSSDLLVSAHLHRISISINTLQRTGEQRCVAALRLRQRLVGVLSPPLSMGVGMTSDVKS
jgi:hypothetical protein